MFPEALLYMRQRCCSCEYFHHCEAVPAIGHRFPLRFVSTASRPILPSQASQQLQGHSFPLQYVVPARPCSRVSPRAVSTAQRLARPFFARPANEWRRDKARCSLSGGVETALKHRFTLVDEERVERKRQSQRERSRGWRPASEELSHIRAPTETSPSVSRLLSTIMQYPVTVTSMRSGMGNRRPVSSIAESEPST